MRIPDETGELFARDLSDAQMRAVYHRATGENILSHFQRHAGVHDHERRGRCRIHSAAGPLILHMTVDHDPQIDHDVKRECIEWHVDVTTLHSRTRTTSVCKYEGTRPASRA